MSAAPPVRAVRVLQRSTTSLPAFHIVTLERGFTPRARTYATIAIAGVGEIDVVLLSRKESNRRPPRVIARGVLTKHAGYVHTARLDLWFAIAIRKAIEAELARREREAS